MSTLGSATVNLKKSPEMNMVDISQIIKINSQKKKKLWTDSHKLLMESWNLNFEATKIISNLYWKLLLTWLLKTNAAMTTTTRHSRDNEKMADRAQKRRALTKFIQTYID